MKIPKHIYFPQWDDVFSFTDGIIKAKYDCICNGSIKRAGEYILMHTKFGGLDWYSPHIFGRKLAGIWDKEKKELEIKGFY